MGSAQILIVEDETYQARGLQKELEGLGYAVPAVAATGEEALQKAAELTPDLVLMDIMLPGALDGIETTRRLHERQPVPVIYLSAYEDDDILRRARETEPYGYLVKPFEERELHATIEMALYRHRVEQRLREARRCLDATLRSVSDAVCTADVSGKLRYFNPAAERLTGWPAAEARGQDLARVLHAECEGAPDLIDRAVAWATEMGAAVTLPRPAWLLTRHGRRAAVEGSVAPVRDDAGAFTGYVCVVRDVSERQAADEQLRRSAEQFRRTQQRAAVSKVAADVSHDFNNLLTVILGNTSLVLCHLPEGDPRLPALLNVETAALSALDLVKRWQGFSRLTDPRQGPANLNVAVQKVWDNLRRLIDVPVALDFRPAPDLWPVQADAAAADEILTNLCINVCNALPRGGRLTLETENVTRAPDDAPPPAHAAGEFARLRLCDPSNGIAPLLRLGGAARHAGAAGATIPGLQEVFESVQRHGGWVDCVSDPRRGTRLDLLLPRARPDAPPQPAAVAVKERQYVPTVLFVDDEPLVRDLGRTVLERNGYRVLLAEDGAEALEVYRKDRHRIDLVILDLTMPALSGDDTFRRLVQLDEQVRVLFCSGYPADHVKSLGREQVVGFLSKPYRNEELLRAVEAALGRSIAGVAPPPPTAESFPQ